jgi:DNA-directed RNA polymerase III subunit RPC7
MSRGGGRGGGRGGRGGGRGGKPILPWDTGDEPDARPSELFPPYNVPTSRELSATEADNVRHFLLLRHQIHSSSLYTSKRTSVHDPTAPRKVYSSAQINAQFSVRSKASVDPFTAVPTYSQRFVREERALPDWSRRPVCRELFPPELLGTIDAQAEVGAPARKQRRLELTRVNALPSAEEAFGMTAADLDDDTAAAHADAEIGDDAPVSSARRRSRLLEGLDAMRDDEGDDAADAEDDEGINEEDQDEAYDDSDAGDYDAENYFDNGDDFNEDYGDGDDGEGTY